MKKLNFKLGLIGLAMSSLFFMGNANALTASGTSISNTATLNYNVGGVAQNPVNSTSASFVVDTLVSMTLTPQGTYTTVIPGATAQVTTFTYANTGNSTIN